MFVWRCMRVVTGSAVNQASEVTLELQVALPRIDGIEWIVYDIHCALSDSVEIRCVGRSPYRIPSPSRHSFQLIVDELCTRMNSRIP